MHEAVRGFIAVVKMDPDAVDFDVAVFYLKPDGAERFRAAVPQPDAIVIGGFVDVGFTEVRPVAVLLRGKRAGDGENGEKCD